jgi:hypothetical protein
MYRIYWKRIGWQVGEKICAVILVQVAILVDVRDNFVKLLIKVIRNLSVCSTILLVVVVVCERIE